MISLSLKQILKTSLKSLASNKARTFLTMLGIIIGVASVIIIIAVGAGAQSLVLGQIEGIGTNLVLITPGKSEDNGPPSSVLGAVVTTLNDQDLKSLEDNKSILGVSHVSVVVSGSAVSSWRENSYSANIEGVSSSYLEMNDLKLADGRFFNNEENNALAKVIVLGSTAKKELFADNKALGEKVKIKNQMFEVVGVLEERGKVFFEDLDFNIFMPVKTMQKNILGINYFNNMALKVENDNNIERVVEEVALILRDNHNIKDQSGNSDDFTIQTAAELLNIVKTVTNALRYFLTLMAGLSLIVGGIGIMNIMLISVNERTREIGLRKAIGASNTNISVQFLLEAVALTLIGGIIGIISGFVLSWLIYVVIVYLGYDWAFKVSLFSIFLAVSVSALVGLIFGLYPARKASKLEPVEALSYE